MCRCGGKKGKCCRVPYIIRDPATGKAITSNKEGQKAEVTDLWSGLVNTCCNLRNVYHLSFPQGASEEEKMTLIGSTILIDVVSYERSGDEN